MDPELQKEIETIISDAQPLLLSISEKILALLAEKYTGISDPVASEIVRSILHGLITGLEFELIKGKG